MIQINLQLPIDYTEDYITQNICSRLNISADKIHELKILKIDIITKDKVYFKAIVGIKLDDELETGLYNTHHSTKAQMNGTAVQRVKNITYEIKKTKPLVRPIVVGSGPAGLFAALVLAQSGAKPILLERGLDVDKRIECVKDFFQNGNLNENSNIQFGEGGAGTFSDGKLKPGKIDKYKFKVLSEFVQAGAPEEILYHTNAHIGTDNLTIIVKKLREKIISFGGEVHFSAKVTDILVKNGAIMGIEAEIDNKTTQLYSDNVILATGHSSRDIFEMLYKQGVLMEQKNFGAGVRIEHLQSRIDKIKFGDMAGNSRLGAASYKLVTHLKNGRNVYSFCMCPGGSVVAAASEKNSVVTNGMSEFSRDGKNSNAAILVTVFKEDFGSAHPLAGIEYQRQIEHTAFNAGGGNYQAPVQRMEDFMNCRNSQHFGDVVPTYARGTSFSPVQSYMPDYITDSLHAAFKEFDDWMPGFYMPDALLTGAETRSTSPVRILRNEHCQSLSINGLYPCGEGAGYAGGIISAAADGIKCAEKILEKYG